jgi:hypothetical protein
MLKNRFLEDAARQHCDQKCEEGFSVASKMACEIDGLLRWNVWKH